MTRKQLLLATFLFIGFASQAQSDVKRNIIKVNVPALVLKNVSGQYELLLSRKVSVAIGIRYMPASGIPFKQAVADRVDGNEEVRAVITRAEIGNFAATPEIRFYLGKGDGRGFYVAPYYRFVRISSNYIPVNYTSSFNGTKQTVTVAGNLSAHNGGLLLGAQWPVGNHFVIDWWIAGAHIGQGSGTLTGRPATPLSGMEQSEIKSNLDAIDIPLVNKTVSVTANRVSVDFDGAFGGLRSGVCFGIRF